MKYFNYFGIVIIGIFLFLYNYYISFSFIDFPISDDYESFIDFMNDYFKKNSLFDRIQLIFSQHNEHRIATMRIICLVYYSVTNKIDLAAFRFFSLLFLFGTLVYLYLIGDFQFNKILFFVPVVLITLVYSYSDFFLMAMAGLSHITMLFFATGCLYYLFKNKQMGLAMLFLFFGVFSNGNGFLLIPLGMFGLCIQRNSKGLIQWSILSAAILLIYFIDYDAGQVAKININTLQYVLKVMPYYLGGIGGYISLHLNFFLGLISIATIGFILFLKSSYKQNLSLLLLLDFYVGTYVLIAIKRSNFGIAMLQREVYFVNSIMIFVLMYMFFYNVILRKLAVTKPKLSLIFVSIIVLLCFGYQYVNYKYWIHKLLIKQAECNNELMSFEASDIHRYKDIGVYHNTQLVTAHALKPLINRNVVNLDKSLKNVIANPKNAASFRGHATNKDVDFDIRGNLIHDNKYVIVSGIISNYYLEKGVKLGVILKNGNKEQYIINDLYRNPKLVLKPKVVGDWYFKFLIRKSDIELPNSNVSIVLIDGKNAEILPKTLALNLNNVGKIASGNPNFDVLHNSKTDSSQHTKLKEALNFGNDHEFVVETQKLQSDNFYLAFEKDNNPMFNVKIQPKNEGNQDLWTCKFNQESIKNILVPGRNLFKLYLIDKNTKIKYPLKSLYFIYV